MLARWSQGPEITDNNRTRAPIITIRAVNMNTHYIGEITEREVSIEFLKLGILVSKPIIASSRYDFIVDIGNHLYKIQVKSSTYKNGCVVFATSTSHTNTKQTINQSYTCTDVDFFATMYQGECYLIPFMECGNRTQSLRLEKSKNNQQSGIKYAEQYLLKNIIHNLNQQY